MTTFVKLKNKTCLVKTSSSDMLQEFLTPNMKKLTPTRLLPTANQNHILIQINVMTSNESWLSTTNYLMSLLVTILIKRSILIYLLMLNLSIIVLILLFLKYEETFKNKLQHMVDIGISKECGASEWAYPCFIIAKNHDLVRQTLSIIVIHTKNILCLIFTTS